MLAQSNESQVGFKERRNAIKSSKKIKVNKGTLDTNSKVNQKTPGESCHKVKRISNRFNGLTEEEVAASYSLPDYIRKGLDILFIGINPGLVSAYKGNYYASPGNHFWKALHLSGLVPDPLSPTDDHRLLHFGIGLTDVVKRATRGSADLPKKDLLEGSLVLKEKIVKYEPKIAVFNGKYIYEVFSGQKKFLFGRQPEKLPGSNTWLWVMPSSSPRCAQLPRVSDKVPFFEGLKKFRDYLNGALPHLDEAEVVFSNVSLSKRAKLINLNIEVKKEPSDFVEDETI